MHHSTLKWIVLGLTALGGVSAALWVMWGKAGESDLTALTDGLFLEYQVGDDEENLCRLTFAAQDDATFKVTAEPETCDVAPRSLKTGAVALVDLRARPVKAHQVMWGGSQVIWIAPDKHTPSKVFEGQGFIIRELKPWKEWKTAMVEQKLLGGALTRRIYFDNITGFLVGMEEEDLESAREVYTLVNTNAQPPTAK